MPWFKVHDLVRYFMNHIKITPEDVQCCVCGFEFGEKEYTPHLQLYIKFSSKGGRFKYMGKFKNVFGFKFSDPGVGWWFGFVKGTVSDNLNYCSKQGKPYDNV